ncbi:sugar porter family MFS transporter [Prevotella sp. 10(H)]|uniref:sugar porter family MFS transporter n=1 Tax=Prevotella sp. 10(H) TaxID=1158294 RepID=UPI0004A77438|nr:sugar porter family MFS transporter [Prevotella sp. 10(H)]
MKTNVNIGYMSFLAIVAALGGYLFGYDTAVISGTITQVSSQFSLDTIQQGWYVGCALVGSILGVSVAGILSDKFGRKKILILSAVLFSISAFGCALSDNFNHLVWFRIIGGMGIGVVSIVSPLYISEVSAAEYRGRLVALYQLAITIGFLGAYLINFGLLNYSAGGSSALVSPLLYKIFHAEVWRSMLGMAFIPAVLFLIAIFFIPESPRWLILKRQEMKAGKTLLRIYRSQNVVESEMQETLKVVQGEVKTDWRLIFKPGIFRAVLIGCAIAILGQFMGVNAVLYYGPTIFENNGLSGGDSLFYQVMVGLANMVATIIAVFIIDKVGRKKLIYYGVSAMIVFLILIAFYFTKGDDLGMPAITLLIFFMGYIFSCAISISAVIFVLLSEMYPMKVRGLAMSIAGFSLWVGTYLIGQLTPWLLQNLQPAGTFILFAIMCVPYMLIIWKLVPETTGKSLEEIEKFWEK